ncbi:acyl-CoA dehydrogenase family protein [Parapedobacter pyrenivorans]|uniref:acyl-CoA dehydrogenase family protein n=1 Tax=Parapedobacter pyrenivorans TaxID=1305674 RepID=UPI001E2E4308|nr:acyl-CoA dehydrogenase family protein [Parapedobacter pyrenivorans]
MTFPSSHIAKEDHLAAFIKRFEQALRDAFYEHADINQLSLQRGLPASVWTRIMDVVPLSVAIPREYGGRGCIVKECLALLSAASYESLPLSLTFGINIALFLEPVAKYANEEVKGPIFNRFLTDQCMGGLMITEPDYGSDALNMRTSYQQEGAGYHIAGTKHWQGLTGQADFWLVAARSQLPNGELARDIDFFISDNALPTQQIKVERLYNNLGLYMIPYGLNTIDIHVPAQQRLEPESTGIKMMLDILHRSRMQFPGMGMGFIKRMLDEAVNHCSQRMVGSSNLLALDSVQFQLSRIQSAYTICSAMCFRSSQISGIQHNLAVEGLEANAMKALVTDLMQESAQLCLQVSGANGYKISHIAGRGIVDSRPFQIFEGSNEMLYTQIAEMVLKKMKKGKETNLLAYLATFDLTQHAAGHFKKPLDFTPGDVLTQRKLVDLGKIISRVIAGSYVLAIADRGFRDDLVTGCIENIRMDIAHLVSNLYLDSRSQVIDDYVSGSDWLSFT